MDPFLVPVALDDQPSPPHSSPQQQPSVDIHPLHPSAAALCRVCPLLPHDCAGQEASPISYPTPMDLCGRAIDVLQPGKTTRFTFNKVISPAASQQDVFGEVSKQVQSAVDGHKASILEAYNDKIKDLIVNQSTSLTIKQDAKRDAHASDLNVADVGSIEQISSLLQHATQVRSVGTTQMNEQSSRSHLIFIVRIFGFNEGSGQQVQGVISLVDLAGNERLAKSGAVGEQQKETQAINLSLFDLSELILALVKKRDHAPYRDSVLKHLLQPYLGKGSKTLVVVNISLDPSSVGESLCSLRYAAAAFGSDVCTVHQTSLVHGDASKLKSPRLRKGG